MSKGNKLDQRDKRHDPFFKRAKAQGYAARSIFKLEEIDQKHKILRPGQRVLDLGCRPGSWLQFVSGIVGPKGAVVGIDRTALEIVVPNSRILVGDVFTVTAAELKGDLEAFDVVLSDMAPDTSGIRSMDQARSETLFERALELAEETLVPGGNFVGKLFQGPDFDKLLKRVRAGFTKGALVKPKGTRSESIEIFVVGVGRR